MESGELLKRVQTLCGSTDYKVSDYRVTNPATLNIIHELAVFLIDSGNMKRIYTSRIELKGILDVVAIEHRQQFYKEVEKLWNQTLQEKN
jgi:hypothetical protein